MPLKSLRIPVVVFFLIGAAVSVFFDSSISRFFTSPDLYILRKVAREATDLGESTKYFVVSLGLYAFCRWGAPRIASLKNSLPRLQLWREWALRFFWSLTAAGIVIHIFKFTVGRKRPHVAPEFESWHFDFFTTHWHWHSFPSGHSQVCFVVATALAALWPRKIWWFYGFAMLLAFTRVITQQHFLSDVFVGSAIGVFVTSLIYSYSKKPSPFAPGSDGSGAS